MKSRHLYILRNGLSKPNDFVCANTNGIDGLSSANTHGIDGVASLRAFQRCFPRRKCPHINIVTSTSCRGKKGMKSSACHYWGSHLQCTAMLSKTTDIGHIHAFHYHENKMDPIVYDFKIIIYTIVYTHIYHIEKYYRGLRMI